MQKAGGIISLIAGIFGTIAAVVTLFMGGVGGAVGAEGADGVVALGWGGVLVAFSVIVTGAIAMGAETKKPGVALILLSILGALMGGTLVAVFMVLSLVGGVLCIIGALRSAKTVSG